MVATLVTSGENSEAYRVLADATTVDALVDALRTECSAFLKETENIDDYDGAGAEPPRPEQIIQYYRASSIALSSDTYNNSAAFSENKTVIDSPFSPLNFAALNCINSTIGAAAPLVDGAIFQCPSSTGVHGTASLSPDFVDGAMSLSSQRGTFEPRKHVLDVRFPFVVAL